MVINKPLVNVEYSYNVMERSQKSSIETQEVLYLAWRQEWMEQLLQRFWRLRAGMSEIAIQTKKNGTGRDGTEWDGNRIERDGNKL